MNSPDKKPSSRRSPYQKFSDKVFSITGMPVSRLLTVIIGLLLLGGALQYAMRGSDQSPKFVSQVTKKEDFLAATILPKNFYTTSFPVQIEKLDWMIGRCNHLSNQESKDRTTLQEKILALLAIKATTLAENSLDPAPTLDLFQQKIDEISGSLTQKDKYKYLVVVTYMAVLAADPDLDFYNQATAAISAIQETTPVPRSKARASYKSAMKYYDNSEHKVEAGKLVQLLGERMSIAKDQEVSEFGSSLVDFPNFSSCYQGSISQSNLGSELQSETIKLLKQLEQTPPRSVNTYNALMNVPEQHLQAGNKETATRVFEQLSSAASSIAPRIRDAVTPKLAKLKTRIDLFESTFPLSGFDAGGRTIGPSEQEQTLIIFFTPLKKRSRGALLRVAESPLHAGRSTTTYLVPAAELSDDHIRFLKEMNSNFRITDPATSKDWVEKSGVDKMPYLIRLNKAGVVDRLSFP